jgi:hypothetical protein
MHELKTNREAARLKSTKSEVASRLVESAEPLSWRLWAWLRSRSEVLKVEVRQRFEALSFLTRARRRCRRR